MQRTLVIWLILAIGALLVIAIALALGSVPPTGIDAWLALFNHDDPGRAIVLQLRLPRVLIGFTVGALLALAGALLQVLLRNPLAEPYILGLSGGAAIGAIGAIALALPALLVSFAAASGAFLSMMGVLVVARREFSRDVSNTGSERLLLSGVMFAAFWGALITLIMSLSAEVKLQGMIFWLMGDLAGAQGDLWLLPLLLIMMAWAVRLAPQLNLLARGELVAASLGVKINPLKLQSLILAVLAAGTAVALAGPVGFVGLIAPHVLRRLAQNNDQRMLLPGCALLGGGLVVIADVIARCILAPQQLPVGAISALLGAPFFVVLLWRRHP